MGRAVRRRGVNYHLVLRRRDRFKKSKGIRDGQFWVSELAVGRFDEGAFFGFKSS